MQAVLNAALEIFARRGFEAASVRDIAKAADVPHGLVRHYFGSKEGVWRAAVARAIDRFSLASAQALAAASADGHADARTRARAVLTTFLRVADESPQIIQLILHEGIEGGERLDFAIDRFADFGQAMQPLFDALQRDGTVLGFDNRSFFLFIFTAGAVPIAHRALAAKLNGAPLTQEAAARYAEQVVQLVLGRD